MWADGNYTDKELKEITQRYFDELADNKEMIFQFRDMLYRAVDLFLKLPTDETREMLIDSFEQHRQHPIMLLLSEIWRLRRIVEIIKIEAENNLTLFSNGLEDHCSLLQHLNQCIFALRRIEIGEEDETEFVSEGIGWLIAHEVSPVAVRKICEEEIFVKREKIYTVLCNAYEQNHLERYAQMMSAFL